MKRDQDGVWRVSWACRWCKIFTQPFRADRMRRHEDVECSQRPGATKRKQLKCRHCGEWFVTTRAVLDDHESMHCSRRPKEPVVIDCVCHDVC